MLDKQRSVFSFYVTFYCLRSLHMGDLPTPKEEMKEKHT